MKFTDLKECPFCGCDHYYSKQYARGPIIYYQRFDGEEAYNGDMYDLLTIKYGSGRYCYDCKKYLGNAVKNTVSKEAEKALLKQGGI